MLSVRKVIHAVTAAISLLLGLALACATGCPPKVAWAATVNANVPDSVKITTSPEVNGAQNPYYDLNDGKGTAVCISPGMHWPEDGSYRVTSIDDYAETAGWSKSAVHKVKAFFYYGYKGPGYDRSDTSIWGTGSIVKNGSSIPDWQMAWMFTEWATRDALGIETFASGHPSDDFYRTNAKRFSDGCIAAAADIFYIGGTKQGALFGEALVIVNPALRKDFRYLIKQGGGMLAKGRLLGLQFLTLFTDDLYRHLSEHAIRQALRIRKALVEKGYPLYMDSYTNQQFTVLSNEQLERLQERFLLSVIERTDADHTAVRICTSWATQEENVSRLIEAL